MTTRTVTAMFDRYDDAAKAVARLEQAGVPDGDISIVSNDANQRSRYADTSRTTTTTEHPDAGTGAGTGATLGTALGGGAGLLAGLGMLAIPGLGPVVAAGWLASTLVGAGAGAATGGLIGALTGAGIDEAHAHSYAEGINRGGTLVTVRTDEARLAQVTSILDADGTVDMGEREGTWRQGGWDGRYAGTGDYAPGTTGALSSGPVGAAASTTTGLGTGGTATRDRVRTYPR
ncbi:general stress protein [Enterovirga sp. CN4-39]|uniref:general stress protein n=1 Tax=Enterovirga sp. CN4-39 TaxID=3400910 RepID=UPI003C042AD5